MTISDIILFPLTSRLMAEAKIAEYERGMQALARHIVDHSPTESRGKSGGPTLVGVTTWARMRGET